MHILYFQRSFEILHGLFSALFSLPCKLNQPVKTQELQLSSGQGFFQIFFEVKNHFWPKEKCSREQNLNKVEFPKQR